MEYLHTMVRVTDLDQSLDFYKTALGLVEINRIEVKAGRFTLVFLATPEDQHKPNPPMVELTWNWDKEDYTSGRNFGHLAYSVENIYQTCQRLADADIIINRPPRDGRMAFVRSPDGISIEFLQKGSSLPPQEPWSSMKNIGNW